MYIKEINNNKIKQKKCYVVPTEGEMKEIISKSHEYYLHLAGFRLQQIIEEDLGYYIYNLTKLIRTYTRNCMICIQKNPTVYYKPELKQIISTFPNERLIIDLTDINKSIQDSQKKYRYVAVAEDHFSKFIRCYCIQNKKAETIVKILESYIENCKKPEKLHTDNGSEFKNKLVNQFCKDNNIKRRFGGIKHPESQGLVEASNKTLKEKLQIQKIMLRENYSVYTAVCNFTKIHNETIHTTTKFKPNYLKEIKDQKIIEQVIHNTEKSQKYARESVAPIPEGTKVMVNSNSNIQRNILRRKPFGKNTGVNYNVKGEIIGTNDCSYYKVKLLDDFASFKKGGELIVHYKLIKKLNEDMNISEK